LFASRSRGRARSWATDNGDPTSLAPFQSHERDRFNGLALAIVRARLEATGRITLAASSEGVRAGVTTSRSVRRTR
jgi:beta-galactosidase